MGTSAYFGPWIRSYEGGLPPKSGDGPSGVLFKGNVLNGAMTLQTALSEEIRRAEVGLPPAPVVGDMELPRRQFFPVPSPERKPVLTEMEALIARIKGTER